MKGFFCFIGAAALFCILSGCFLNGEQDNLQGKKARRIVTDMVGTKVGLPNDIERAVVLLSDACRVVYALGVWDKVVGVSRYCYSDSLLKKLIPDISDIPSPGSGFEVNMESLVALEPDVVILWGSTSREPSCPVAQRINKRGIPTIVVRCWKLKDIYGMIRLMGEIFNRKERAEALVSYLKEIVALVERRTERMHIAERPSVIWLWTKPTRVTGGVGLTNELIELAGGKNPAADFTVPYATVSVERIIEWNPDAIVIWESARYDENTILNDPQWRTISAVKKKRVKKNRRYGGLWCPEVVLKLLELAIWLHPDKFRDINIDEAVEKFYGDCYGRLFWDKYQ